jgi:hydrogenase maturation protease
MGGNRILVIGFGNPGRGDDGLGPALAERLEGLQLPGVTVECDYQLAVEHASLAAEHEVVIFVDAALDAEDPFYFRPLTAAPSTPGFTSHGISPAEVLYLAGACYGSCPAGYLLGIRAHDVEAFRESLSSGAEQDLAQALEYVRRFITSGR